MQTNAQVAAAFVRGETAQSGSMRSTGTILYSYETPIAYHDGDSIVVSLQKHSVTTTRHHSELWSAAYAAGYDGPGRYDKDADTVSFHGETLPAARYGRARPAGLSGPYGTPRNCSDHDARAVVWTYSDAAYRYRVEDREWYEQRHRTTVSRKEPATT